MKSRGQDLQSNRFITAGYRFLIFLTALIVLPQFSYDTLWSANKFSHYYPSYYDFPAYVVVYLCIPLVYSFSRQTMTCNEALRDRYFESVKDNRFISNISFLFRCPEFWIKAVVVGVMYITLPLDWVFKAYYELYYSGGGFSSKLLSVIPMLGIMLLLYFLGNLTAIRFWNRNKEFAKVSTKKAYIKNTMVIVVGFYMGSYVMNLMLPIILSCMPLIVDFVLSKYMIAVVAALILLVILRYLNALRKRKLCIKRLKKICAEKGYELSKIQSPYSTVFKHKDGENFSVFANGRGYACKFITARRKNIPIVIRPDEAYSQVHTIRFIRLEILEYTRDHWFKFDSEYQKILIVNPSVKHVFTYRYGKYVTIDNGDEVAGYKIYTANAFLNALERDVIYK